MNKRVINNHYQGIGIEKNSSKLIDDIIDYVNANLKEELSLDAVAKKFYISKFHLSHKFKDVTEMTFHNFVLKKRLNYSKQLLRKHQSSTAVFSECGFSSYSYFLKSFKKEFGITPKEFINNSNNKSKMYFNDSSYR